MEGLMQFSHMRVTSVIDHAARFHPDSGVTSVPADCDRVYVSYRDLRERALTLAYALKEDGVRPGDRVATMAFNTHRHLESWYAIMGLGAVCHTLNPRLFLDDLAYIANDAEDVVLLADHILAPVARQVAQRVPSIRKIIYYCDDAHVPGAKGAPAVPEVAYERLLRDTRPRVPADFDWTPVPETAACGLCYTSGTTGKPKGVLYSHRSNYLHMMQAIMPDTIGISSTSVLTAVVPLFHANSWGIAFAAPAVGAHLVLPGHKLDGKSMLDLMADTKTDRTAGVPTVWLGLMQEMERTGRTLPDLKIMVVGGAALPEVLITYFSKFGVEVRQAWGMTELSPIGTCGNIKRSVITGDPRDEVAARLSQGVPVMTVQMRVVGPDGKVAPHDGKTNGNIQVRGPHVLSHYYKKDEPATDADGWFDTGDVGNITPNGYMRITDRSKDVIKSGGEWISSIEIENAAVGHPDVAEAAVIAVPHPKWTERPLLIVVPKEGREPTSKGVLDFVAARVAKWWVPEDVVFLKDIPHTATGKINKLALRQRFKTYVAGTSKL